MSVLGPLLFLLFINDLPNSSNMKSWLFADDTALGVASDNFTELKIQLNSEINKDQDWLLANKLSVHYAKKNTYYVHPPREKVR